MRILLFGDGAWATRSLEGLLENGHEIIGVVTRFKPTDNELLEVASRLRLHVCAPENARSLDFLKWVESQRPDLNVCISYDQIIRPPLLDSAPLGFINFHAGKLPYYRGRSVVNWAIINGEEEIGLTAHYVDEGIDTGDIILQKTLPIRWTDTYGDVLRSLVWAFPEFVRNTIELVAGGKVQSVKQSAQFGSYFPQRGIGDEWLDWNQGSRNLYNKIRGISRPGPGARSLLGESPIIVWKAYYEPDWPSYIATPGQVVGRCPAGVYVKTGDSRILLQECALVGGSPHIPAWRIGTKLGMNVEAHVQQMRIKLAKLEETISRLKATVGEP